MSMLKPIACGTFVCLVSLSAGRAQAGQPIPPVPPVPPVHPVAPVAPMPPWPPVQFELPPMPPWPPMPPMSIDIPRIDIPWMNIDMAPMHIEMPAMPFGPFGAGGQPSADDMYDRARDHIEQGRFERAISDLDRVIGMKTNRTDAALYWKAYAQNKLGQRTEALTTLAELTKSFGDSRWVKDAKALEIEIRQSSGQRVSPDTQSDEELKLIALNAMMQSDPEQAVPTIEKLLAGNSSTKVKERALFVLSQSRSTRAREILTRIAKGASNPDLQLRAIRYVGTMGSSDSRQILDEAYRASADPAVKRAILRSFMTSNDRVRLLELARSEKDASLRGEAVRQLGNLRAEGELGELYQGEATPEVKKSIIQAMFVGGGSDRLVSIARTEKDPELRRTAIRNLGQMRRADTSEALVSIYQSDTNVDVRRAVINALFLQQNDHALVTLGRAEKNSELLTDIVRHLGMMPKSKEAMDFLAELLNK